MYRSTKSYENQQKMIFDGAGKYGIPEIEPTTYNPCDFISFNYAKTCKQPEKKGVHFFLDDYQFNRVWNNPDALLRHTGNAYQKNDKNIELEERGKKLLQDAADVYTLLFHDQMHVNVVLVDSRFKLHADIELIYRCETNEQAKYLVSQQDFLSEKLQQEQHFTELSDNCISVLMKSE